MPIFEFYCPDNNRIYQFYAKTRAQAARVPKCPDNPKFRMQKMLSRFAVNTGAVETPSEPHPSGRQLEDARAEAVMSQIEKEFEHVDEGNPKEMGKILRRMVELTGEKVEGSIEETVRRLEEERIPMRWVNAWRERTRWRRMMTPVKSYRRAGKGACASG